MRKKMTAREKNVAMWGWMFITPTILGLLILNFYPIFNTVWQSFCKTGDFGRGNTFVYRRPSERGNLAVPVEYHQIRPD